MTPTERQHEDARQEAMRDQRIRFAMSCRCSTQCVLPANHVGAHMRQDGTRIGAHLTPIQYGSLGTHHMVECRECLVILNSGHHYPPTATHHAQRLAGEHNAEHHPACSGERYLVNPYAPEEGTDIWHGRECDAHPGCHVHAPEGES
jgi:hypothetical protein